MLLADVPADLKRPAKKRLSRSWRNRLRRDRTYSLRIREAVDRWGRLAVEDPLEFLRLHEITSPYSTPEQSEQLLNLYASDYRREHYMKSGEGIR